MHTFSPEAYEGVRFQGELNGNILRRRGGGEDEWEEEDDWFYDSNGYADGEMRVYKR